MIVDTMTFDEITEYLLKTSISETRLNEINKKYIIPKGKKYRREILKWRQNHFRSSNKIFSPLVFKENIDEELVVVPFAINKDILYISFVKFRYRGTIYVACKSDNETVYYYSYHCLNRYAERFLKLSKYSIDNNFIAKMLIDEGGTSRTTYFYNDKENIMYVSVKGAYLCDEYDNFVMMNTFISPQQYYQGQRELDSSAYEGLRQAMKENYGCWVNRA